MRPATFEPEEIIAAGNALLAEGVVNITGFALRKRVGGGDPSRLRQVWDGYLAGQTAVESGPLADLPPELADAVKTVTGTLTGHIVQLLRELNDRAVRAAEHRIDDVTCAADEQKAQAERELADAVQTVDDLEQKLEVVTADLQKSLELLDGSREREQATLVELAQVRERLAATEERLKEAEKAGREVAEQHRQQTESLQYKLEDAEHRLADSVSRYTADLREMKSEYNATVSELKAQYLQREESLLTRADAAENAAREARASEASLQGEIRALKEQSRELTALLSGSVFGLHGNAGSREAGDTGVKTPSVVTPVTSRQKKEKRHE
ncbi:hypothetical protein A2I42_08870 [Salmonella enterica]|uniref:DNA-binding protein n=1 Tax=Salmonella enterica TaxID=28901 RepID=A0A402WM25_SALER|nr:hypothetical protein [Salmonella enterica]EAS2070505.1 hypothetical protein [Salmonella enterica]EAX5489880.1 hypothetical protein [Salmonella enterica]MIV46627.1 DNA-binding protein [Salmonella enterica]